MKKRHISFVAMFLVCCLFVSGMPSQVIAAADLEESSALSTAKIKQEMLATVSSSKILNYVEEAELKSHNFVSRLPDEEDLHSYVFQNEDGSRTAYFFSENVKYVDKDGIIQEKDISLAATRDGYKTTKNEVSVNFSNSPSDGITMGYGEHTVTLKPIFTTKGVTASKKDNAVEYVGLFDNNTTLKYTPLLSGIKEDIVLTKYTGVNEYSFTLTTNGLGLYESANGYFLAESKATKAIFYLGDVIAYDANYVPHEGTLTVKTVKENQEYTITVSVDEKFLTDKDTVYPVTIDPTITIKDSTNGSGAIQDAPIFSARPSSNHGTYEYDRVGTPSADFGVGRTVIRLYGLINSQAYKNASVLDILSVKFYAKEATGSATQYVNLYPLQNTGWTESGVTWNNIGVYYNSQNYGASMAYAQLTEFNITGLVLAWKTGTYSANAGFIMMSSNESANKCFVSCEHSDTSRHPYVVMEYNTALSLNTTTASLEEGETLSISTVANINPQTITWTSSNSVVATVSSSGIVTARKSGTAKITATLVDSDGVTWSAFCTIYVHLPDGVYYFNNPANNYRIEFVGMSFYGENEPLTVYDSGTNEPTQRFRMFKIQYIGNGTYCIRSMLDNAKGWVRSGSSLISKTIQRSDGSFLDTAKWKIESTVNGYYIYSLFGTSRTVTCPDNPDDNWDIVLQEYSSANMKQTWTIKKITASYNGVDIRNAVSSLGVGKKHQLTATMYSTYSDNGQNGITWTVTNGTGSATINSSGLLTGISPGTVVVTATYRYSSSQQWSNSLTVNIDERYFAELIDTYGFTSSEVALIRSLYDKVDTNFPYKTYLERAWMCSRLLGGIVYGGEIPVFGENSFDKYKDYFEWYDVAGDVLGITSEENYFVNILGYSESEYLLLKNAITNQHRDCDDLGVSDFAHYQISLASRLTYKLGIDGIISNIYTSATDETISYLAGWLGDAVLLTNGTTVIGNDDYCADLDAENSYRYILNGTSSVNAISEYYCSFSDFENRATIFLDYVPYEFICDSVFYELIDKEIINQIAQATELGDDDRVAYYFSLLEDEEYHWEQIQEIYPDTYNFLRSLEDNLENIGEY